MRYEKDVFFTKNQDKPLVGSNKVITTSRTMEMEQVLKLWRIEESESEFSLFDFDQIADATNNFSDDHKLGQGGFGPVYKGELPGGLEIAIKRLSSDSVQGLMEFKTEIQLIAKLQHTNLVRLLGCCVQADEKMLVYEYMHNKSLDFFIFDADKGKILTWDRRFRIVDGVAQGLLYLHRHSRLRVIHRDLKASNILLDRDMNPKISDFGMARIFCSNVTEANTTRVVGTHGYIAPEYASEGLFSIKSDVFSFGVLLLEIISGKRTAGFYQYGVPDVEGREMARAGGPGAGRRPAGGRGDQVPAGGAGQRRRPPQHVGGSGHAGQRGDHHAGAPPAGLLQRLDQQPRRVVRLIRRVLYLQDQQHHPHRS
ncbi:hypothetical protein BS78_02G300900 [Paspalum vaginatum]|nr:hypothetical protein BS78_02G300900 [Paspalum vaginatum]